MRTGRQVNTRDLTLASGATVSKVDIDPTLAADSDAIIATQKAVKAYADSIVPGGAAVEFGAWDAGAPWIKATPYHAATDGLVIIYQKVTNSANTIQGKTDSANPPTTLRFDQANYYGYPVCMPVKQGDYWQIESSVTPTIFWLPIISSTVTRMGSMGTLEAKSDGVIYQANTDGFVIARNATANILYGYSDTTSPPTTERERNCDANGAGICMAVKSGDYWKTVSAQSVWWMPIIPNTIAPGEFGGWEAKTVGTIYRASTDGYAVAYSTGGLYTLEGYTDSNPSPVTARMIYNNIGAGGTPKGCGTMPVKAGDYWKVTSANVLYWIPIVSVSNARLGALGDWETKAVTTVYRAATDGYVVFGIDGAGSASVALRGKTDSANPPTTIRGFEESVGPMISAPGGSSCMPVKVGDYWTVTQTGSGGTVFVYWIPVVATQTIANASVQMADGTTDIAGPGGSGGWTDIADMTLTVTLTADDVALLNFSATWQSTAGATTCSMRLVRDSSQLVKSHSGNVGIGYPAENNMIYKDAPGAGTYTYKAQWYQPATSIHNYASSGNHHRTLTLQKIGL